MAKKFFLFLVFTFWLPLVFAGQIDSYLVEFGRQYLNRGLTQQARVEFEKALQVNPENQQARAHLADLRQKQINQVLDVYCQAGRPVSPTPRSQLPAAEVDFQPPYRYRPEIKPEISRELPLSLEEKEEEEGGFYYQGDYQLSLGVDSGDFIWKRANPDLNEASWRIVWPGPYGRYQNTFDPAVFSQLRLKGGYDSPQSVFGFHSYLDISPWSFIGKSNKVRISSDFGDTADIQLKYWSNIRHTIGETIYSNQSGNIFNLGEHKVKKGKVFPFNREGLDRGPADVFRLNQELKIKRDFWPLRELWFDFSGENTKLRIFPAALQDQAYSSDNPLGFTNRHMYWGPSPWLSQWDAGRLNPGPGDFYKGYWDDSLAFLTRTSGGERITNLRGFSLAVDRNDFLFDFTAASPKNLWQDYDEFDTLNTASRGKYFYGDNLLLGFTHASKQGFSGGQDAFNHVLGADASWGLTEQTSLNFEVAASRSEYDRKSEYTQKKRGNAYQFNLINSSEEVFGKDFYRIRPPEETSFYRWKLSFTRMDPGFDAALANYHHTRDDVFWSRHLTFRRPFAYDYFGLYGPGLAWDDLYPYRLGDGIDSGRHVASLRWEGENIVGSNLDLLFDIRDVRGTSGGLIENVSRLETTFRLNPRLRLKGLGIYHHLPKTEQGKDPFLTAGGSRRQRSFYGNESIEAGKDPSLKTFSAGLEYDFFDWLAANFVWQRSNDTTLAYDNFPRGLFEWTNVETYNQGGHTYRQQVFGLYNHEYFPTAPYPYYNMYKAGLRFEPFDDFELYLNYTRNTYNWAQIIDDNMNHFGLEAAYLLNNKIGFYLRYVYARANNLYQLAHNNRVVKTGHHNVFSEVKYRMCLESEWVAQYGVGGYGFLATSSDTPFGGGVSALDTQHIFRLYYRRKF